MKIQFILTPIVFRELSALAEWIYYCPSPFGTRRVDCVSDDKNHRIVWLICIDSKWSPSAIKWITHLISHSKVSVFETYFISLEIPKEESVYYRFLADESLVSHLPYGSKSGPNQQFFKCIDYVLTHYSSIITHESCLLLLEVDAYPVQPGWIMKLEERLNMLGSNFLIAGSHYSGISPLHEAIQTHYNGNAVYGIGHSYFAKFVAEWRQALLQCVKIRHYIAYDVAIPWLEYFGPRQGLDMSQWTELLYLYNTLTFSISDSIANISGEYEISNSTPVCLDILDKYLIVHSKNLYRSLALLQAGFYQDSLFVTHKLVSLPPLVNIDYFDILEHPSIESLSVETISAIVSSKKILQSDSLRRMIRSCMPGFEGLSK